MGKIYEVLNKAEKEGGQQRWSSAEVEEAARESVEDQPEKEFNFVQYSLNAPKAAEVESAKYQAAAAALARKSLAEPAREVMVDLGRIDPHLVAFRDGNPGAAEQYNTLAVSLISGAAERPAKRVLVASAQRGEGRTCVALNLACALARANQRVLVIDGDLHHPSVLRFLGIDSEIGLAEAFERNLPIGQAAIRVLPYGFVILPTRDRVDNPAQLLASPDLRQMLEVFEPDYDFILFDSPPLLAAGDSRLIQRLTDAALLVIRAGKTGSSQLSKAVAAFSQDDILGVVLNRINQ